MQLLLSYLRESNTMQMTIIGTGNVANALCEKFVSTKNPVLQVVGRNPKAVNGMAKKFKTKKALKPEALISHNGIYIIAVNDDQIANVFKKWYNGQGTWVHTSGSTDLKVFGNKPGSFGVMYPAISISPDSYLPIGYFKIPYLLEASDPKTLQKLKSLINNTKDDFFVINSEKRLKVHLAAVFINNFGQHIGNISYGIFNELKLDNDILKSLALITLMNVVNPKRKKFLTGPAIRKDLKTIKKHEKLLKDKPEILLVYRSMTRSIMKMYS